MKLTQKTLFQCFEKSRPQSPVLNSSPSKIIQILFSKKKSLFFVQILLLYVNLKQNLLQNNTFLNRIFFYQFIYVNQIIHYIRILFLRLIRGNSMMRIQFIRMKIFIEYVQPLLIIKFIYQNLRYFPQMIIRSELSKEMISSRREMKIDRNPSISAA